ncbi:ribosome maturation factor RimM [Rhizohabitans arisaemae]|uniref:ribosome maturation factor RimM n=1 Tax=Rhizohabitans arisaemae TaxID=2720610 RepID=UPI0024B18216|nr:ribosome maturation factor RimM [Rhizohabitans arisaemae]
MRLVIGRIGRPHGVRGEVTVEVRTDEPGRRFTPGAVISTESADVGNITIEAVRWHSGRLLLRVAGVADRDAAEELRGTVLVVDSAELDDTGDPDEFYDHQLIGLAVVTTAGEAVGTVEAVLHHGQDLLVVRRNAGEPVYIPFVKAIVPEVDLGAGRLVVDAPPGLLDLNEAD